MPLDIGYISSLSQMLDAAKIQIKLKKRINIPILCKEQQGVMIHSILDGIESSLNGVEVIVFNLLDADEADNADFKFAAYQLAAQHFLSIPT